MKKKILYLFVGLMLVALTACSGSSNSTSADQKEDGVVELTWQFWSGDEDRAIWEEISASVTEKYPNIKVKLQVDDWDTYWTKLTTQLASGTTADIISMQSTKMPVYASKGVFKPINDYVEANSDVDIKDFNEGILDGMSYDGKMYALPYDYGALTLYYNKDMFDKNNVPYPDENMTWNEFVDRAKNLTNTSEDEYGFAFAGDLWNALPWIMQLDGDYLTDDGKYVMNDPKIADAIQFLADLSQTHKVAPSAEELANSTFADRWKAGKVGMIIDGPWSLLGFKQYGNFEFDVSTLPLSPNGSNVSFVAGSGFGISSKSKYPEEAFKAISVITSKENLAKLADAGRAYPARNSVVENFNASSGIEHVSMFDVQGSNSVAYETSPKQAEAEDIINQELEAIYFGQSDVAATLEKIQKKLDSEINK